MTQDSEYLFKQFKRLYTIAYLSKLVRLVLPVLFVLLSPILIYDKFISGEYFDVVFLSLAELLFLFLSYSMYSDNRGKTSFTKSRIYKGFHDKNIVNRIIVSDNKILFDLSDMEDEVIYLKNSEYKRKIVNSLKSVFGESKIVTNV
jgi:hypothetical protein